MTLLEKVVNYLDIEERDRLVKCILRGVNVLVSDLNYAVEELDTIANIHPIQTFSDAMLKSQIASLDETKRETEKLFPELNKPAQRFGLRFLETHLNVENEIVSYLTKYGNTKESDIINYGVKKFNHSSERIKKVIRRLVIKGKIHYLVHSKLEPPEAYVSLEEVLPSEELAARIIDEVADVTLQKA